VPYGHPRRRWAASLYAAFGLLIATIAVASASPILVIVMALSFVLAVAALRAFPVERHW
jgi:hypothetical protein